MSKPDQPPGTAELRALIAGATGGYRTLDDSGEIELHGCNPPGYLCEGHEDGIDWRTLGDAAFTTRVTPYVVHCLLNEAEFSQRRCEAYAKLLLSLGVNPSRVLEFMQPEPASVDEAPAVTKTAP